MTDVHFAKATKGLKGQALRQKIRELDAQFDMDFETFIRGQFPFELVTILGIPAAGPDTADDRRGTSVMASQQTREALGLLLFEAAQQYNRQTENAVLPR